MEYVDGQTVSEIIRNDGPIEPKRAAGIAADVAAALGFAHRKGVVHRDVKPGNVLITKTGEVKVADFGIARAMTASSEENLTQTGSVMGTATYFSPEQAQGKPVDARSDLYSLGVVLYEMASGKPPFSADSPVAIAYKHVQEPIPSLSERVPGIPRDYEAITAPRPRQGPRRPLRRRRGDARRPAAVPRRQAHRPGEPGARRPRPPSGAARGGRSAHRRRHERRPSSCRRPRRPAGSSSSSCSCSWCWARCCSSSASSSASSRSRPRWSRVPDVVGQPLDAARDALEQEGFEVTTSDDESDEPADTVLSQSPAGNEEAEKGSTVVLTVSAGIGRPPI